MSQHRIKQAIADQSIEFAIDDLKGQKHVFSLIPMKTKVAANIFHNILLSVIEGIATVTRDDVSEDDIVAAIAKGLKDIDFDSFWFIAENVFRFAVVDGDEVKKLDDCDFASDPLLLYRATYEGLKGNYPDVFRRMGLDAMFAARSPKETDGATPDQK